MRGNKGQQGFSVIELVCVMTVIAVMSAISIFYLRTSTKFLAAEEQAIRLSDVLQEARQKSLTQKEVMRVEIDNTTKSYRLIGEGANPLVTTDDRIISNVSFLSDNRVRVDDPSNISAVPVDSSPVPKCAFASSNHPLSLNNSVCTIRFLRNGMVASAGTGGIGTGAVVGGFTIYVWKPTDDATATTTASVAKAITVSGTSASIRMWEYRFTDPATNKWFDVRRMN